MQLPKPVADAVLHAVHAHPDDVDAQTEAAQAAVRGLPDFRAHVAAIVDAAVVEAVYDARSAINKDAKKSVYSGPAKVEIGASAMINAVSRSVTLFDLNIGGKTLGDMTGADLLPVAESERSRANGILANAELLTRLRGRVKDDQRVRDAVSLKWVNEAWKAIEVQFFGRAADA